MYHELIHSFIRPFARSFKKRKIITQIRKTQFTEGLRKATRYRWNTRKHKALLKAIPRGNIAPLLDTTTKYINCSSSIILEPSFYLLLLEFLSCSLLTLHFVALQFVPSNFKEPLLLLFVVLFPLFISLLLLHLKDILSTVIKFLPLYKAIFSANAHHRTSILWIPVSSRPFADPVDSMLSLTSPWSYISASSHLPDFPHMLI